MLRAGGVLLTSSTQHALELVTPPTTTGAQLGYVRVSTIHQSLDAQLDARSAAGVDAERTYRDKLSGTSTREQRPGLAALLEYARTKADFGPAIRRTCRVGGSPISPQHPPPLRGYGRPRGDQQR